MDVADQSAVPAILLNVHLTVLSIVSPSNQRHKPTALTSSPPDRGDRSVGPKGLSSVDAPYLASRCRAVERLTASKRSRCSFGRTPH